MSTETHRLIDGAFDPITYCIGFLEAPYQRARESLVDWRREIGRTVERRDVRGGLPAMLRTLEPLTMPPCRDLLVPTRSRWVAFFDNSARIADLASPVGCLCTRLGCRGVVVSDIPQTIGRSKGSKGTYGAVVFELFAPEPRDFLNYERSVAVVNDGGRWTFVAQGTPQPFEETAAYDERSIRKRFTSSMLRRYCRALGLAPFDSEFYGTEGFLVESAAPDASRADRLVMSLAEARREIGLA